MENSKNSYFVGGTTMTLLIDLHIKQKVYKKHRSKLALLTNFSLQVNQGDRIAIIGESGAGKSSLLNILGLLDRNYSGSYTLFGTPTTDLSSREIASWRNNKIGFVLQESALINTLTIEENIKLPLLYASATEAHIGERNFKDTVEALNIESILSKKPFECSGGEKSRAVFARGTIMSPAVILSDEPTASLDSENSTRIVNFLLNKNYDLGTTLITVTHDLDVAKQHNKIIRIERKG